MSVYEGCQVISEAPVYCPFVLSPFWFLPRRLQSWGILVEFPLSCENRSACASTDFSMRFGLSVNSREWCCKGALHLHIRTVGDRHSADRSALLPQTSQLTHSPACMKAGTGWPDGTSSIPAGALIASTKQVESVGCECTVRWSCRQESSDTITVGQSRSCLAG